MKDDVEALLYQMDVEGRTKQVTIADLLRISNAAAAMLPILDEHQPEDGACFECECEWPCVYGDLALALGGRG